MQFIVSTADMHESSTGFDRDECLCVEQRERQRARESGKIIIQFSLDLHVCVYWLFVLFILIACF